MAKQHINLRISEKLFNQITSRHKSPTVAIERDLSRYYSLLCNARVQLKAQFTEQELNFISDTLEPNRDQFLTTISIQAIPALIRSNSNIKEAQTGKRWLQVDLTTLQDKLDKLSLALLYAMIDTLEIYWQVKAKDNQIVSVAAIFNYPI